MVLSGIEIGQYAPQKALVILILDVEDSSGEPDVLGEFHEGRTYKGSVLSHAEFQVLYLFEFPFGTIVDVVLFLISNLLVAFVYLLDDGFLIFSPQFFICFTIVENDTGDLFSLFYFVVFDANTHKPPDSYIAQTITIHEIVEDALFFVSKELE